MVTLSVLFIVGPTAVGKSALGLHLARAFDGEIVNADSRQVYRYMDIGTAKPSPEDRAQVRHHLVDILGPDQEFSLAVFLQLARRAIGDIYSRGKLPIVVGGSGQYVWALADGWRVPSVPPDARVRRELEEKAKLEGAGSLHKALAEVDPDAASKIGPYNIRRLVRALEIYRATGIPPSTLRRKGAREYRPLVLGLHTDREALYWKIDRRVEEMLVNGLVGEVEALLDMGYSPESPCMSGMGYREMNLHLSGELTLEAASQRIKYATHRYARRQYAWFRLNDTRIHWLESGPSWNLQAKALVDGWLMQGHGCDKIASTPEEKCQ